MNRLSIEQRAKIIACLVEGNSIRGTSRLTGNSKTTILKLLVELGYACEDYQNGVMKGLSCKRLQCDEIWSFCYAKSKNLTPQEKEVDGSIWTFVSLCADTKLVPHWFVGDRNLSSSYRFFYDLKLKLENSGKGVQITTDGFISYPEAILTNFGKSVNYASIIKQYDEINGRKHRYVGSEIVRICGRPNKDHISTSYCERQNLTMRMGMRRFTRKTNAFSKSTDNHANAIALHFMYYNFARVHQTLKTTPAVAAGVANHVWSLEEIARLVS